MVVFYSLQLGFSFRNRIARGGMVGKFCGSRKLVVTPSVLFSICPREVEVGICLISVYKCTHAVGFWLEPTISCGVTSSDLSVGLVSSSICGQFWRRVTFAVFCRVETPRRSGFEGLSFFHFQPCLYILIFGRVSELAFDLSTALSAGFGGLNIVVFL